MTIWAKRRFRHRGDFRRAKTIEELRALARARTAGFAFEYVEGGSEDERTLNWNRAVFETLRLVPRMLVDTSARHARITLFGRESRSPLIIAPTGLNGMLGRGSDVALARAAGAHGIPFTQSTLSNERIERIAREAPGRLWMQLYMLSEPAITDDILHRAEQAGFEALVFTVDTNVFGAREWDARNYRAPARLRIGSLLDAACHPGWAWRTLVPDGAPQFVNVADHLPPEARTATAAVTAIPKLLAPAITWDDVARLRDRWRGRLLIKRILAVEDAERVATFGCDGIVLSNHGGRQLDSCVSPLDVLPAMRAAVGNRLALVADGGFRRGTDVAKALALGADAVMIGRAALYGLAAGGEPGVAHALTLLEAEFLRVLGQLGCRSPQELGPQFVMRSTHRGSAESPSYA
jgi:(S)-mandelate dehydrogenase